MEPGQIRPRPHVAVVAPIPSLSGGTETILAGEIAALRERADVTLITRARDAAAQALGCPLIALPVPRAPGWIATEMWLRVANAAVQQRRGMFDRIYAAGANALLATHVMVHAVFAEIRRVQRSEGGCGPRAWFRAVGYARLAQWERRVYTRHQVHLATVSWRARQVLAQHYGRDDTTVFFGAPDGRRFSPAQRARLRAAARAQFGWAADDFVVLAVGNSWVIKGFDILQAVWRSGAPTPAARLWLVGSDVQARALAPAAVRRTMHVDDIAAAYAAADLLVAPSRGETLGLPVLEAAAMGLPVLVSTCAGAAEAMPAQARVASLDPESWRQRITAMADPAARASLGHACALAAATLDHKARADAVADWILGT